MISIIVPIFNSQLFLDECLNSIYLQTYTDFEVLCVDDGSTDNSASICGIWAQKDPRFKYLRQENGGVSKARNTGLDHAKGDYICFLDSDDLIHRTFFEKLINNACGNDAVLCDFTRGEDLGQDGLLSSVHDKKTFINLVIFERIKHPSVTCFLYKRNIIDQNSIRFVEGCIKNEDYEFYLRYLTKCQNDIIRIDYKGYFYRDNPESVMSAPITKKSFTSIEAAKRIDCFLLEEKITETKEWVSSLCVLFYAYKIAKQNNKTLYDELHAKYDVKSAMKTMCSFPSFNKRIVAYLYLLLGKKVFYHLV